jgi:hypothetical protein
MNALQVSKVAHEADRALCATLGEPDEGPFEELTQAQKDEIAHRVDAAFSGRQRGVTPSVVARQAAGRGARERAFLFTAIVHAFAQQEEDANAPPPTTPRSFPTSADVLSGPPAADSGQAPGATLPPPQTPAREANEPTAAEREREEGEDEEFHPTN